VYSGYKIRFLNSANGHSIRTLGQNDQPNDEEFHVTNVSQAILDWLKASVACTEMESMFFRSRS
jgi:hypothetical protein